MKTSGNTILITGGSAGIGFELARQLIAKGNQVIITGRNQDRLDWASGELGDVAAICADVINAKDVERLVNTVNEQFTSLNMLINNAGVAIGNNLLSSYGNFETSSTEMLTNYLSVIRLTEKLLPLLSRQKEAAIVNVSSRSAIAPRSDLATYSASKAALHSYTLSMRIALSKTSVKVFELMPPAVNTDLSATVGGPGSILPLQVAEELLAALEKNIFEIHVAETKQLYELYLSSPAKALEFMNKIKN
jgi:uncharacterized oxidoreductase